MVAIFNSEGKFLSDAAKGQWRGEVWGIAFDTTGEVFIGIFSANRIIVCDLHGSFLRTFGSRGSGNGYFEGPAGVAIDGNKGLVYVSDYRNDRSAAATEPTDACPPLPGR